MIGVLAEAIGAIAVVASVIYLAVQVRDSSNQNTVTRTTTLIDEFNRMQEVLISSPDVVDLFTKLNSGDELTNRDETLLESVANRYLSHWFSIQTAYDRGTIDKQFYDIFCEDVSRYVNAYPKMTKKFLEVTEHYSQAEHISIFSPIFAKEKNETS